MIKRMLMIIITCITAACVTMFAYPHKFNVGDCAIYNQNLVEEWQTSDGTVFHVTKVGVRHYEVKFVYPKLPGKVIVLHPLFKRFDEDFIKFKCPKLEE